MDGRSKIPYLPGDIVHSILLNLPVKSLSRFKSCCKSWHCCIDDADFIKSHLHKSSVNVSLQKFVLVNLTPFLLTGTRKFEIVSTEASINADSKVVYLNIPEFFCNYCCLEVFSCSGLVFMTSYDPGFSMTLLNPAVGKYKLIPNSLLSQNTNCCSTSPIFGFAYDFVAEDYKVICVHYLINDYLINGYLNNDYVNVVEVYSVGNQCWKAIHNIFPDSFRYLFKGQVSLNGVIHRMSYNGSEDTIISFHLVDEKFTVTIVPSTCGKQSTLHALGDRVCVFTTVGEEILIWSLEKDRWNCINKFPTLLSLIGMPDWLMGNPGYIICVKANGNILWRKHEGPFIEYDVRKNEYTEFKSTQVPDFGTSNTLYVESLVSLKIPWD